MTAGQVEITIQSYGRPLRLVCEYEVQPAEAASWDPPHPGCPEEIEVTRVWRYGWQSRTKYDITVDITPEEMERIQIAVEPGVKGERWP